MIIDFMLAVLQTIYNNEFLLNFQLLNKQNLKSINSQNSKINNIKACWKWKCIEQWNSLIIFFIIII